MRRVIMILALCVFFTISLFAITDSVDMGVSAYKRVDPTGTDWVRLSVQNLSGEALGPGRSLDLEAGEDWLSGYAAAFKFVITGRNMQRVDLSFSFTDFIATDGSGTEITGNAKFNDVYNDASGWLSDYGDSPSNQYRYLTRRVGNTNYKYREEWPSSRTTARVPLDGGELDVSGIIKRKKNSQSDSKYSNSGLYDAQQDYTRTGVVMLSLDQASYDAAPSNVTYVSTVTVTCTVE